MDRTGVGMTGREKIIKQFMEDGIYYMFGNPGTVEEGFIDAISKNPEFHYITCLHESVAVAMADGYARKTKQPALVQLHSGVGLGNGIGMLYQAYRGHSPIIVIAGESGVKYDSMDAQMACNLVDMARPVTKYAARVVHRDSVLRMIRRAIKMAVTPPAGPVFLSLPMDILDEINEEEIRPSVSISFGGAPQKEQMEEIAAGLAAAVRPVILAGDGVNAGNAVDELERCAKILAAEVYGVNSSCINISQTSPFYQNDLGHMFGENSTEKVKDADAVLIIGTYVFPEVFPELKNPFKKDARIFHIDVDAYEIAKNHPVSIGIVSDIKTALQHLNEHLQEKEIRGRDERLNQLGELSRKKEEAWEGPTILSSFLRELQSYNNDDVVIFDEALTASSGVLHYLPKEKDGTFFQTRGGSLGVGIPGALGIQLAAPQQTVWTFTGDGGSMYTIQALYTAVRYQLPIKIVICKNGSYGLLKDNISHYWEEHHIKDTQWPDCFELTVPEADIDFIKLAESMGVAAVKAETEEEAVRAAHSMAQSSDTFLVELNTKE